jgi:hypothetical protein
MLKVTPTKTTSVGFGRGNAVLGPAWPLRPTTGMPDRVDTNNQHDLNLKDGVKGPGLKLNPGRKQ